MKRLMFATSLASIICFSLLILDYILNINSLIMVIVGTVLAGFTGLVITAKKPTPKPANDVFFSVKEQSRYVKLPCPQCKGTGQLSRSKVCPTCDGKGYELLPILRKQCDTCNGTGKQKRKVCRTCEGAGEVMA